MVNLLRPLRPYALAPHAPRAASSRPPLAAASQLSARQRPPHMFSPVTAKVGLARSRSQGDSGHALMAWPRFTIPGLRKSGAVGRLSASWEHGPVVFLPFSSLGGVWQGAGREGYNERPERDPGSPGPWCGCGMRQKMSEHGTQAAARSEAPVPASCLAPVSYCTCHAAMSVLHPHDTPRSRRPSHPNRLL